MNLFLQIEESWKYSLWFETQGLPVLFKLTIFKFTIAQPTKENAHPKPRAFRCQLRGCKGHPATQTNLRHLPVVCHLSQVSMTPGRPRSSHPFLEGCPTAPSPCATRSPECDASTNYKCDYSTSMSGSVWRRLKGERLLDYEAQRWPKRETSWLVV